MPLYINKIIIIKKHPGNLSSFLFYFFFTFSSVKSNMFSLRYKKYLPHLLTAGLQDNVNIEMYNKGSITTLTNDCLSQANYVYGPGVGACRLDEDHVILIGGKTNLLFFIHDVATGLCERKEGWGIDTKLLKIP